MISNRPGNNIKREPAHHSLKSNTMFFPRVNLILVEQPSSFVVVRWLETSNITGNV